MPNQEYQPVHNNRLTSHSKLFRNIPCYLIALSCLITAISPPAHAVALTKKHSSKAGAKGKHVVPQKADEPVVHPGETILLQAMKKELDRSFENLKNAGDNPLYFLSYRVYDNDELRLSASYGALDDSSKTHRRSLDIEARVGTPEIDNTHKMRENIESTFERMFSGSSGIDFSIDNDESAIRTALCWRRITCSRLRSESIYRSKRIMQ